MALTAGTRLGPYEVVAPLGAGGMGEVYRATDTRLGRAVALKVLPVDALADEERRQRFAREARAASALSHPNVATIYEFGEADGRAFIAMELVDGQPLGARLAGGPLPTADLVEIARQTAEALEEAHAHGITHRDIKPGNLMVTPRGRVKVLDFGLARMERRETAETMLATKEGSALGTVPYMSPEQAMGREVDGRSDLFSLGAVIYEMATGRRAFGGTHAAAITDQILHSQPTAIARWNYDVPEALERIVRKCLEKDRERRYQSARELVVDLENLKRDLEAGSGSAAAHMPAMAVPPAVAQRPPLAASDVLAPPAQSQPKVVWAGVARRWLWPTVAVLALAAIAIVGLQRWRVPPVHAPLPSKIPEANEYFQRAMLFLHTQQDTPRARQLLEKALALDPGFAHARAWYGFTHVLLIDSGQSNDTSWLYKAEAELKRALQDDPNSARAHAALSLTYQYQGRKDLMRREAERALELDPNERDGLTSLAIYHQFSGEYERSQALLKALLVADPLFMPARWNVGENERQMGNPAGSIPEQEKILEQDPKNIWARVFMGMAYLTDGNAAKAREALARGRLLEPQNYQLRVQWALLLAVEGKREEALQEMDAEVLKYGELVTAASNVAEFYAVLGDRAKALDWLDRAVRAGDERAEWFERDPLLANIQQVPRFREIVDGIRYRRAQLAGPTR